MAVRPCMFVEFAGFENKKYTDYDSFHGNSQCGEIPTKREAIRMLRFVSKVPRHMYVNKGVSVRNKGNFPLAE